jgi:DNA invertase Pin-like site-specific DNA recombinase
MKDQYSPPPPGLVAGARVWAYLRDSGGPSQDQSVAQQESEIKAYCKRHNLYLVPGKVFRDVARSGGSTIKRDEFIAMIDQSEDQSRRPDGILIWNYARFSRDYDDFQFYKSTLKRRGIILHSLTDSIPVDDFAARVMETIISLANEEKRRQTSRDVKRGLKDLAGKGYAPGTPPRGYIAVPVLVGHNRNGIPHYVSKWEPDPVLSELVKLAWQMRAAGKSYKEITKATDGKLYTAAGSWVSFFNNKSYLGFYGKDEIPDHHEPLINQDVWDAVQRIKRSHPIYGAKGLHTPRRVGYPTLLSGFTFCLECGSMMTHTPGHKRRNEKDKHNPWRNYICGKKNRHGYKSCSSRRVGADKAETAILETVMNKVFTPDYLMDAITEAKKKMDSTADIERQITAEKRRLEDLDIGINRLLRTIEKTESESANILLKERELEKAHVRTEINRLSLQLATAQIEITPEAIPSIVQSWRDQFNRLQEKGNIREIKDYLMQFIAKIELGYNQAKIYTTYPMIDVSGSNSKPLFAEAGCGGT